MSWLRYTNVQSLFYRSDKKLNKKKVKQYFPYNKFVIMILDGDQGTWARTPSLKVIAQSPDASDEYKVQAGNVRPYFQP